MVNSVIICLEVYKKMVGLNLISISTLNDFEAEFDYCRSSPSKLLLYKERVGDTGVCFSEKRAYNVFYSFILVGNSQYEYAL